MGRRKHNSSIALPWEQRFFRGAIRGRAAQFRMGLALAATVVLGGWLVARARQQQDLRDTRATIGMVHRAVLAFRDREGRCPRDLDELLRPPSAGARDLRALPRDAWGNLLRVRCVGEGRAQDIEVVSAGDDGSFDDLNNIE